MTNAFRPAYENNDIVEPSSAPPQRPPPPPPLKLPLTDPEELQPHKKPRSTHASYSPQSERRQSKSSLDHELRQYQQYSERIHKLADSSVESLVSYGKSQVETESCPPRVEKYSLPNTSINESGKHENDRQEQASLVLNASDDHTRPEPTRGGEYPEISNGSFSLPEPSSSYGQGHSNTEPSSSGTAILRAPVSSAMQITPSQSISQSNLTLASTKDHCGDETRRKSNDSVYWQSANSHNSSCSLSEEESQLRSADAIPPHSVITRPNPKIISIAGNQRRSDPTRNLSPVVLQPRGHHSASALGFGGPSDWEHFGDNETEEIDDTDLYSRSKPDIVTNTVGNATDSTVNKAAELPVDVTLDDKPQSLIQPEPAVSDGDKNESPYSIGKDIAKVEPATPEQRVESPKPENSVEFPKSGLDVESPKLKKIVESYRPEEDVESHTFEHNVEVPEPKPHVESLKDEKSVGSPTPEENLESHKHDHNVESSKPGLNVESPKHEKSVTCPRPENGVESLEPEQSIEIAEPERAASGPGDENSKTTGTELQVESKLSGSTRQEVLRTKAESKSPQRQNLDVDENVKAWSDDSTDKAHEHQSLNDSLHVDGEPSCDQPVKSLPENHFDSLSSGDTSSDQPFYPHQQSKDDFLPSRLSSNQTKAQSPPEETPTTTQASQLQAPKHGTVDIEDDKVPSMSIENSSEVKQIRVKERLATDQVISRGNDVAASSDGQSSISQHGVKDENTITIPIKPLDPTNTDKSPTSSTLHRQESTSYQGSPLKEGNSLRSTEIEDIYADLDPWGRASLHRYILMLHEEVKAKTDLEKFNVFTVFANRESKLRAVLYGADDDVAIMRASLQRDGSKDIGDPTAKRSEKALPALPALPPDGEHQGGQLLESTEDTVLRSERVIVPEDVEISLTLDTQSIEPLENAKESQPLAQETKDESPTCSVPELKTPRERVNKVWTQFANYIYPSQSSSPEVPKIAVSENIDDPPKPAYVPRKYNQTEAEISNYLSKRQSAYRSYAALTMSSLDNGLCLVTESEKTEGTITEPFVLEVQKESAQNNQPFEPVTSSSEEAKMSKNDRNVDKADLRRFVKSDFDPLCSVLPSSGVIIQDSVELQQLHGSMDAFPDDFSFIRESVLAWDAVAKKERERFERERHIRQGESERKIDELFDNHEIGYGDISELEADFKQSEASRKADEDRHEYHTFLSNVFDVVWTQLHYEIDHLTPLYKKYTTLIKDSLVGKDMFEVSTAQFTLPPIMSALLALHQKLEVRHQKAFEAVLERDRRLKRTEISAWYTLGNVSKVKELEKQFEVAEKNALVAYCQHRDERANKLMDVLDHNTLRGVGANQDYMECLMKAVRRVASGRASTSIPSSDPGVGVEELKKAKSITTALSTSSEQIVRTFHVADMLLNAADYELSVAKAKLANADAETFKRLKEERKKEDQKLMRDLEHRLALIREDTRKTHDEVVKLLVFLGVENGQSEVASPIPDVIPLLETKELVHRALNNAKKIPTPGRPGD